MAKRFGLLALLILGGVLTAAPAMAQDKSDAADSAESKTDADADTKSDADSEGEKAKDDAKEKEGEAKVAPAEDNSDSPVEDAGKTYNFVGARYRLIVVPKFIISMFADGGTTVAVHAGGPEFGVRKAGFEFNFALWLAGYGMDPTPFKAKTDGEDAWELVASNIKVLYLTSDFLWSHSFSPQLALNYGMGAGIGFVWGPLNRNQAYRSGGGFQKCPSVGFQPVCGNDNNHYGNYEEPAWTSGGSKPILFPWLALQTGLRYKPHRKFVARFDTGFGLSGFFFGLGADYGL
ncbi:MAG: hypothetical protein ACOY0T_29765 [Myxococcota bacterium]